MKFEKDGRELTREEFEKLTQIKWVPYLDLESGAKIHKKGEMTREQVWLGSYYKKEILSHFAPDVVIRWIDPVFGWGVFALRDFRKMEFIAEYVGKLRKRKREDAKNSYCFEYVLVQGIKTRFTIDAQEQGGVARFINHSAHPNLLSALATFDHLSHVILYAKEPIAKGTQLCYDYGPDYWSKRTAPLPL